MEGIRRLPTDLRFELARLAECDAYARFDDDDDADAARLNEIAVDVRVSLSADAATVVAGCIADGRVLQTRPSSAWVLTVGSYRTATGTGEFACFRYDRDCPGGAFVARDDQPLVVAIAFVGEVGPYEALELVAHDGASEDAA